MSRVPNLKDLDKNKTIFVEEIADEPDEDRALRHYGDWLKNNKDKVVLIDRFLICGRASYKIKVLYQKIEQPPKPAININGAGC